MAVRLVLHSTEHALVAQWREQRFPKPRVAGSIPAGGTGRNRGGLHDFSTFPSPLADNPRAPPSTAAGLFLSPRRALSEPAQRALPEPTISLA
jgi:hypothetical protein